MKKIISTILATSILLTTPASFGYADEHVNTDINVTKENNTPTTYTISLDEAIEMALTNNAQLIANEHRQHANKINIKSARLTKNSLENLALNISSNFEAFCMREGYYVTAGEVAYNLSVKEADKIKANISYNVTESYYNVVLMGKLVNAAQNSYNLAVNNMKVVEAQYKLGLIAKLDYENASISVTSAENVLETYKLNQDIAIDNLKILLNKDAENCTLVLTDEIECEEYTSNVEKDIVSAMESRYDITALKENKDLASKYFDLAKILTDGSATYNTAYASYVEAEYNYENTKKLIGLSIKSSYNNIITSKSNMETAKSQYEMELKKYDANKLKYELGMITNNELTQAINTLYDAQVSYANAKLNYRMAIEKYKYEITIGL